GLGFAALEQGRAMSSRQEGDLAVDGADLLKAASVQALVLVHDQAADSLLLDVVEGVLEDELGDFFFSKFSDQFLGYLLGQGGNGRLAGELARGEQGADDAFAGQRLGVGQ